MPFFTTGMDFGTLFTKTLTFVTLVGNVVFLAFLVLYLTNNPIAKGVVRLMTRHALVLGFFISASSTIGSLLYSEVVGFPACILCWIQRIFMYPLMFLFALAIYRKERNVLPYALLLAALGGAVALYQWVKDMLAIYGHTTIPCPAVSDLPSCDKIYVLEHGYVTIPMIALNAFLWIILVMFFTIRSHKA